MFRNGGNTLSDIETPTITIVCAPCGRRARYNVQRLMARYGDEKMPDLLATLANCPKTGSASIYDRCKAVYEKPLP
jgi:hypothetical protein